MAAKPRRGALNVVNTPDAGGDTSGFDESPDILSRIRSGGVRTESEVRTELGRKLAEDLVERVGEAHGMTTEEKQSLRQKLLNGKINTLRETDASHRKIYAELIAEFNEECNRIGQGFDLFEKYAPAEQQLIDDANALHERAELAQKDAEADWYIIPGNKEKAIAKAKAAVDAAVLAKAQAKDQADITKAKRLLNADFSELFTRFQERGEHTKRELNRSRGETQKEYGQVQAKKQDAFKEKAGAAKLLEELKPKVADALERLRAAEEVRDQNVVGTEDRAKAELACSDLRREVETLNGQLNQTLAYFQVMERATVDLEVLEQALLTEVNGHDIAITNLEASIGVWKTTFQGRIAVMKSAAGIEAHQRSDDVGAAITQKNAEAVTQAMVAVVDSVVGTLEKHNERLINLVEVRNIQAKGLEDAMTRLNNVYKKTMERSGASETPTYGDHDDSH